MSVTNKKGLLTAEALRLSYTELVVKRFDGDCRKAQMDVTYSYKDGYFKAKGHVLTTYGNNETTGYDVDACDKSIRTLRESVNKQFYSGNGKMVAHEVNAPIATNTDPIQSDTVITKGAGFNG